jgi:hypothetical protein
MGPHGNPMMGFGIPTYVSPIGSWQLGFGQAPSLMGPGLRVPVCTGLILTIFHIALVKEILSISKSA